MCWLSWMAWRLAKAGQAMIGKVAKGRQTAISEMAVGMMWRTMLVLTIEFVL